MNPELFNTRKNDLPKTNTVNEAGGSAYKFDPKHALAQYACTGTLSSTYYTTAETQLEKLIEYCKEVDPEFIAKTCLYAREKGYMKDMPALLLAILSTRDTSLASAVFPKVINNGKMLRNYVQVIRSGVVGRKSFGTRLKKLIVNWLQTRNPMQLLVASIGNNPRLSDVIKMVHPKPTDKAQEAMFAYLIERPFNIECLPGVVADYIRAKNNDGPVTKEMLEQVPFRLLDGLPLSTADWRVLALNGGWTMTRMNLNTFVRHGVFEGDEGKEAIKVIAKKLSDPEQVKRSKVFPYQLFTAFLNVTCDVPEELKGALQAAMEVAIQNVPTIDGDVAVLVDTSGSMGSPVTGYRGGGTSSTTCVDVASLMASAFMRQNGERCTVVPFDTQVRNIELYARDSVMTNAEKLSNLCGGGTDIASAFKHLNDKNHKGDLVVLVSDNQSWVNGWDCYHYYDSKASNATYEWQKYKERNPNAKLVCLDITPYESTQVEEKEDVLNIGGFSDVVFNIIKSFVDNSLSPEHWVGEIEAIKF